VEVAKYEAISNEGKKYGIMFTPAMVINDKVVVAGRVPTEGDIEKLYKRELGIK
jgi:protein-disulfide isomerase